MSVARALPAATIRSASTTAFGTLALATLLMGCDSGTTDTCGVSCRGGGGATVEVGVLPTPLGQGTFGAPIQIERESADWRVSVEATPGLEVAVRRVHFDPSGHTAWHRHHGPTFIQVLRGTMTFYESDDPDCTPIVRTVGQGYYDFTVDHAHIVRNESTTEDAEYLAVHFAPPGTPLGEFSTDVPRPENCPF
jgi:hypothetical protein